MPEDGKRCKGCGDYQALSNFYANSRQPDGKHYYCKECCKLSRKLEAVRKRDKRSRISYRQIYRAEESGVAVDKSITLVQLYKYHRGECGICNKYVIPGEASMDHKVPIIEGGGHTWDNLLLVHLTCNLRKGRMSHEQAIQKHQERGHTPTRKSRFGRTKKKTSRKRRG